MAVLLGHSMGYLKVEKTAAQMVEQKDETLAAGRE
jgi:hypothetical protein